MNTPTTASSEDLSLSAPSELYSEATIDPEPTEEFLPNESLPVHVPALITMVPPELGSRLTVLAEYAEDTGEDYSSIIPRPVYSFPPQPVLPNSADEESIFAAATEGSPIPDRRNSLQRLLNTHSCPNCESVFDLRVHSPAREILCGHIMCRACFALSERCSLCIKSEQLANERIETDCDNAQASEFNYLERPFMYQVGRGQLEESLEWECSSALSTESLGEEEEELF